MRDHQAGSWDPYFLMFFLNNLAHFIIGAHRNAYADDQQLYYSDTDHMALLTQLNNELSIAVDWFKHNGLMAKPNKFQLMLLGDDHEFSVVVDGIEITRCHNIDFLGVNIDFIGFIIRHEKFLQFYWLRTVVFQLTALFINMRILKFKSQLTIAFFAAVNHLNGPLRKQNFSLTGSKGHGL